MENYKYFKNDKCEYFPCHKTDSEAFFNCMFCYCPLYFMDEKCGGGFYYTENDIKCCDKCLIPHKEDGYDYIMNKIRTYFDNER